MNNGQNGERERNGTINRRLLGRRGLAMFYGLATLGLTSLTLLTAPSYGFSPSEQTSVSGSYEGCVTQVFPVERRRPITEPQSSLIVNMDSNGPVSVSARNNIAYALETLEPGDRIVIERTLTERHAAGLAEVARGRLERALRRQEIQRTSFVLSSTPRRSETIKEVTPGGC